MGDGEGFFVAYLFSREGLCYKSSSLDIYHTSGQHALKNADRKTLYGNGDGVGTQGSQTLASVLLGTRIVRKLHPRGQLLQLWLSPRYGGLAAKCPLQEGMLQSLVQRVTDGVTEVGVAQGLQTLDPGMWRLLHGPGVTFMPWKPLPRS